MLLPPDLDLDAPREQIVQRLVVESGYDEAAAREVVDDLLSDDGSVLE
ncbi:hypothetical protein PO878_20375 [Iamia majanohamensis]|uniref:Uncharacterized protein n=1 Tax=Iamia majanohamensis TaxID=467976 RepID=A0AAE9YFG8_9ACTN|nr:hypothetical protein [Iamia majanohamensis]WCO66851.1 hypothetical protein PO878_20375 [Iamia majanohamensis]